MMSIHQEKLQPLGKTFVFRKESNMVPDTIKPLVESISEGNAHKVKGIVTEFKTKKQEKNLENMLNEDETILHRAVKMQASKDIVSALVTAAPELLSHSRDGSELYKGQTALHIAITGQDLEVTEELLRHGKSLGVNEKIFSTCATGSRFGSTVMLGELPLIVAALTLNISVFDKVLKYGAKLDAQNSTGETVCHCLIRYAHLYPEKMTDIMKMVEHVGMTSNSALNNTVLNTNSMNSSQSGLSHLWLLSNEKGLNPLKLAAKLGQQSIFKYIMEMKDVYCYVNSEDGLFDVELYDVTDIDSITEFKLAHILPWYDELGSEMVDEEKPKSKVLNKVPTLEMIFDSNASIVFKFIELSPLRYVINKKWAFYRWFFTVWGFLHIMFMIGYTFYSIRRSTPSETVNNGTTSDRHGYSMWKDGYVTTYALLSLFTVFLYVIQEIVRIVRGHMPWTWHHVMNCYHNGPLRLLMQLFAATILADLIWKFIDEDYGDFFLVISMILGWWFLVFFLRGLRQFSFFTVMIQKVLVGDMFRFSIVIGMELLAFSAGMFIAFRGTAKLSGEIPENENVFEYSKLVIAMFKMMFGLTSLDVLFEAPYPWFAIVLYVAFVLLTTILMVNSLIAMMSNTCSVVSENREIQYRVQQLSIILFFESVFPVRYLRMAGEPRVCDWFDAKTGKILKRNRSFMEVRSLHEVMKNKSRHRPNTDTMLETIFHTITSIDLPKIGIFEDGDTTTKSPTENEVVAMRRRTEDNDDEIDTPAEDEDADETRRRRRNKKRKKKARRHADADNEHFENPSIVNTVSVETRGGLHNGANDYSTSLPSVELI